MQKLSPNYRTDDAFGLDPKIRAYLDEHYFKHLPIVETPNPKLLIVFSGGNAIGKSTLARKIGAKNSVDSSSKTMASNVRYYK